MKALVVDDDRVLSDLLSFTLRREGFQVIQAADGKAGMRQWEEQQPDLVLLDVNLSPKPTAMDGFDLCRAIRAQSDVPIILLTVRAEEEDIIRGLNLGADDYVLKPFSPRQLIARVQAVLRRTGRAAVPAEHHLAGLRLDPNHRVLIFPAGEQVSLTPLEYRLLDYLALNAGQVLPFEQILTHVWGAGGADRDMLRQLVRRLRAKIERGAPVEGGFLPIRIETVPALGYGLMVSSN